MSRFFINRPIFAIVISLIIVILGTISAFNLPIAQYPQISPPTITVSTTYTGANSDTVNETIAQVVEQQVNGVEGMDYMSSTSANDGRYNLQVVFKLGTNGDMDSVKFKIMLPLLHQAYHLMYRLLVLLLVKLLVIWQWYYHLHLQMVLMTACS